MAASLLTLINDVLDLNQIERGRRGSTSSASRSRRCSTRCSTCAPRSPRRRGCASCATMLTRLHSSPTKCACAKSSRTCWRTRASSPSAERSRCARPVPARWSARSHGTGVGIPADSITRSSRVSADRGAGRRRRRDRGWGWRFTKRLVELHGGNIWLDSVPGEGTTSSSRFRRAATRRRAQRPGDRRGWRDASYA